MCWIPVHMLKYVPRKGPYFGYLSGGDVLQCILNGWAMCLIFVHMLKYVPYQRAVF